MNRFSMAGARCAPAQRQRGFTLVEMAVVLVVIGVILSAVMIGRDVQRNAEGVKIRRTLIDQWAVVYNTYRQRYGIAIGDSPDHPRNMVNGANYAGDGTRLSGGDMSKVSPPPAICNGSAGDKMARAKQPGVELNDLIRKAGIELPPGRGPGYEDRYVYQDTNGNPQELQICFQWNPPGTPSGSGNVMVISGLTPEMARSLAVGLKGTSDANSGTFRQEGISVSAKGTAALDWTVDNTMAYGGQVAANNEEQVVTVVAHYKMNQ
jgi:prepilin-type N-terminal cleavage/methylation domain-containing protein